MEIPESVQSVLRTLESSGYEAWCVGGCVRDLLLERTPDDYDVTTSALPEETLPLFGGRVVPTGLRHGTVTVRTDGGPVEVTTFRCDGAYLDHRRPASVSFTRSLTEDLRRRDFTVNAMAMVPVLRIREVTPIAGEVRTDCDHLFPAMEALKTARLLFGVSVSYDSNNCQALGSERFFDEMIAAGAKFAWFFTYLPLGREGDPKRMATAEQRAYMYHQIREFRKDKPLFTVDLWNDGEYMGGCVAGGRRYCHINANGDVEPCVFTHYSDSNIRSKTLLEAYRSPLFMEDRTDPCCNSGG